MNCIIGRFDWLNGGFMVVAYLFVKLLQMGTVIWMLWMLGALIHVDNMHYLPWAINEVTDGWFLGEPNNREISLFPVKVKAGSS